jgi:acetylglutamate kinase
MEKLIEKANILMEALPYIRRFFQKTIVIKYGGHAMVDEELKHSFVLDVVLLSYIGLKPVIVHGGGPQIEGVLKKMGKKSTFVDGMRVTDSETMEIVEMVLGRVNQEIVGLINQNGGNAIGLSGKDGHLLKAKKLQQSKKTGAARTPDIGMVGEVETVNPAAIEVLDSNRFIPIISPIGAGEKGQTYNINADLVAGKIASALKAEKLILLTDVKGVLNQKDQLLSTLESRTAERLIKEKAIRGGMIPKVQCCLQALREGVTKTHIIDGRVKHAILLEIFTDRGIGTQISHSSR